MRLKCDKNRWKWTKWRSSIRTFRPVLWLGNFQRIDRFSSKIDWKALFVSKILYFERYTIFLRKWPFEGQSTLTWATKYSLVSSSIIEHISMITQLRLKKFFVFICISMVGQRSTLCSESHFATYIFFLAHLSCIWIAENFSRWTSEIHAYDGENCKIENVFATFFWCLKFVAKLNRSSFDTKDIEKYYDGK